MSNGSTVDGDGRITIPPAIRDRLDVEPGMEALFRFDPDGAVPIVFVPADPIERFEAARERASNLDIDVSKRVARERSDWV